MAIYKTTSEKQIRINEEFSVSVPADCIYTTDRENLSANHILNFIKEGPEDCDPEDACLNLDDFEYQGKMGVSMLLPFTLVTDYNNCLDLAENQNRKYLRSVAFLALRGLLFQNGEQITVKETSDLLVYALMTEESLHAFAVITPLSMYTGKFWGEDEVQSKRDFAYWLRKIDSCHDFTGKDIADHPFKPLSYREGKRAALGSLTFSIPDQLITAEEARPIYEKRLRADNLDTILEKYDFLAFRKDFKKDIRSAASSGFTIAVMADDSFDDIDYKELWNEEISEEREKTFTEPFDLFLKDHGREEEPVFYKRLCKGLDAVYTKIDESGTPDFYGCTYLAALFHGYHCDQFKLCFSSIRDDLMFRDVMEKWLETFRLDRELEAEMMKNFEEEYEDDDEDDCEYEYEDDDEDEDEFEIKWF